MEQKLPKICVKDKLPKVIKKTIFIVAFITYINVLQVTIIAQQGRQQGIEL